MGSCSLTDRKRDIRFYDDSVFFVSHKSNSIIKYYQSGKLEVISFETLNFLPKHSAFTYSDPFLYILGGSDTENPLRNEALKIHTSQYTLEYIPTLPMSSKHGDAYIHNDYLYYIGGVYIQNHSKAPTPFMRFLKDSLYWEVLGENLKSPKSINISSSLLRPGSCKINGTVYIIGGELYKPNGEKTMNTLIYLFDLDALTIQALDIAGVSVISPRCCQLNDGILVLGGYNTEEHNLNIWIVGSKLIKVSEHGLKISGNRPLQKLPGCFIVGYNKKVKILREDKLNWKFQKVDPKNAVHIGEVKSFVNSKRLPEAPSKVTLYAMYKEDTERSCVDHLRYESRKLSPSNLFNSQLDFDYSQTFQLMAHKELSDINSIIDLSAFK